MTRALRKTALAAAAVLALASASTVADAQNFDRGGFKGTRADKLHRNGPDARRGLGRELGRGLGFGALGLLGAGLYGATGGFADGCQPLVYDAFAADACG